jgi:hypothetical protein
MNYTNQELTSSQMGDSGIVWKAHPNSAGKTSYNEYTNRLNEGRRPSNSYKLAGVMAPNSNFHSQPNSFPS